MMSEDRGRTLSITTHPPYRASFPWVEGFPCIHEAVDSATPGKPCVQNDMISDFRIEYETLHTAYIDR